MPLPGEQNLLTSVSNVQLHYDALACPLKSDPPWSRHSSQMEDIITTKRMISDLVLKQSNGMSVVIPSRQARVLPDLRTSSSDKSVSLSSSTPRD